MFDEIDRSIIRRVSGDIPESMYPFRDLADEMGIHEDELLKRLESYRAGGALRRFGAVLRHQKAGFTANGMSIWNVADADVERAAERMTACGEVSHCYERPRFEDWSYNLYAMIHGKTKDECLSVADNISRDVGITDYKVLFSLREFKKSSVEYFSDP